MNYSQAQEVTEVGAVQLSTNNGIPPAVLIAVITVRIDCSQTQVAEDQHWFAKAQLRPQLAPIEFEWDPIDEPTEIFVTSSGPRLQSGQVRLSGKLTFKNVGNSMAEMLFGVNITKDNADTEIRRKLRQGEIGEITITLDSLNEDTYPRNQVLPDSTTVFNITIPYRGTKSRVSSFFHFFLLYRNDFDVYFDTYLWIELRYEPITGYLRIATTSEGDTTGTFLFDPVSVDSAISIPSFRTTYEVYLAEDAQIAEDALSRVLKSYRNEQ